ncbi:contractile injection system protein, VgrG/Pvc8 family [Lysobacter sp. FW306-1B-D06B]|uniref:phage late control D family protein n=1 Tax=Lysobacter sp. FW306-1B-D06B TaxID=3140250 RepID=UPI0031403DEF
MELVALSHDYGEFYAPCFVVRLAGQELVRDLQVAVSQVEVDMVLGSAWHFTFTVVDAFDPAAGAFRTGQGGHDLLGQFAFGASIEVCMGYRDAKSMPTVINGVITEVSTSFPDGGAPELIVSGYDPGFLLTLGKNSDSWRNQTDGDVVRQIARFHNLDVVVDKTEERRPQIEQNQESDWDFLKKLAQRNHVEQDHFELYVDVEGRNRSTLHFGGPRVKSDPVVHLEWGRGLLSFRPQANLAGQVAKVEVIGSDTARKTTFIGRASADLAGARAKTIAEHLGALVRAPGRQPVLRLRQPVFSQAEADQRAKAALGERTREFLTGEVESIGLPELRPDRTVKIDGIGTPFSKTYYIQQATHRIDGSGYRTRFRVRETAL